MSEDPYHAEYISWCKDDSHQPLMGGGQRENRWSLCIDSFCLVSSLRLRHFQSQPQSHHRDTDYFSLPHVIETHTFSVSVSVLSLILSQFQSQSHHWDSDIFNLSFGLIIKTQTFSALVSSLRLRNVLSWSQSLWSKSGLSDPFTGPSLRRISFITLFI